MYEIVRYLAPDGKIVVSDWLEKLRDTRARVAIDRACNCWSDWQRKAKR